MPDFKLPSLGEDIQEVDVLKVLVSEGDTVEVDQPLLEIETEKATLDVPAEAAGVVTKIHVSAGDTINVGQVIVTIESGSGAKEEPAAEEEPEREKADEAAEPEAADADAQGEPTEQEEAPDEESEPPKPERERPAASKETDGASDESEDEDGDDEEAEASPTPERQRPAASAGTPAPAGDAVFASPSLRRFAREIGVDLAAVAGSGPGGRVTEDDIKRAARDRAAQPAASTASSSAPAEAPATGQASGFRELPDFSQWGEVRREKLTRLRRTVSRNMAQSWTEIPHVHLYHHADITAMEELRQAYKERAREAGGTLTISVMLLKIVASALRAHPRVNASYDVEAQELVLKDYVHIGVAVDTDRGLVVPKIENVDEKNIIELSIELNEIAERARENKLELEEMRGSTFTVTNLGSLGTGYFDPIINWPEVAVLGLGRAERQAVWNAEKGAFEPRLIMPLSLGHDHRVLDGADGARFMTWIVEAIRNPMLMALEG
jgi:pyruvate dehydrogenase E2 component (dihydrolipoamide acetyltransferase)